VDLSYDPDYIDKGLEQKLIARIEVVEAGRWVEVPVGEWASTKARLLADIFAK